MDDGDYIYMRSWTGTIIGPPQRKFSLLCRLTFTAFSNGHGSDHVMSVHEGRIYTLKLLCDKDYPEKPLIVRFHSQVKMTCADHETGVVEPKKFGILANWQREYTILAEGVHDGRYTDTTEERNVGLTQPEACSATRRMFF
ncbi:putative ubiquitin-conjugating enzyme/RWD [Helianthus anomalus]